jgi:hypothetical protein
MEKGAREMARLREVNGLRPTVAPEYSQGAQPIQKPTDALPTPSSPNNPVPSDPEKARLHAPGTWGSGRLNEVRSPANVHPAYRPPGSQPQAQHPASLRPGNAPGGRPDDGRRYYDVPPGASGPVEPDRSPMQKVQAVSRVQGGQPEPEEEKRGGLRKLFKRKEVAT